MSKQINGGGVWNGVGTRDMTDETAGRESDDARSYPTDSHPELSTAVLFGVADTLDSDVEHLPPLRDVIDPEILDALGDSPDVLVQFEYAGCRITVRPADSVIVAPPAGPDK